MPILPQRFDAILIPVPDISVQNTFTGPLANPASAVANNLGSVLAGTLATAVFGALILNEVTQLEHDKGNVLTAHRVDGGYALTQRGGNKDDRVFLRMFLRGPQRFIVKQYIDFLANQKSVPIALITREVIFVKSQIESVKTIVTNDRRETIVIHVILRQLRSAEGLSSFLGGVASGILPYVFDKNQWFGVDDVYADDSSANGGGTSALTLTSSTLGGLFT